MQALIRKWSHCRFFHFISSYLNSLNTPPFMPLSSFLNYRFTSICKPFLILCFDLIAHSFGVSPLLSLVFHFFLPTYTYVHVPFFAKCFSFLLKSVIVASTLPTYFLPSAPLLSLYTPAVFCWCCMSSLPTWGIAISTAWSHSSVVFLLRSPSCGDVTEYIHCFFREYL